MCCGEYHLKKSVRFPIRPQISSCSYDLSTLTFPGTRCFQRCLTCLGYLVYRCWKLGSNGRPVERRPVERLFGDVAHHRGLQCMVFLLAMYAVVDKCRQGRNTSSWRSPPNDVETFPMRVIVKVSQGCPRYQIMFRVVPCVLYQFDGDCSRVTSMLLSCSKGRDNSCKR